MTLTFTGRETPIVHRIMNAHNAHKTNKLSILTKGDANDIDDRGLYPHKQHFLGKDEIMGRAYGFLPYVGNITILLNDYPWMKWVLIGTMAFFTMIGRDTQKGLLM